MPAPHPIIAIERSALDRWGNGDPSGFLEVYDDTITYFDPATDRRLDGLDAMRQYYEPFTGKITVDRYEMLHPHVQDYGDTAVLTYNLRSHARRPDGSWTWVQWNSTVVYRKLGATWKSVHSHWSYVKPELKQAPPLG
jgi:ketosteroid isomerase-like protein